MAFHKNKESADKEFLDNHQYTKNGILRYEKIFGKGFISTGGLYTTKKFVNSYLNLQPGQKVLDVGCGIGGSAIFMAKNCGAKVLAVDLSENMLSIGRERLEEAGCAGDVIFENRDVTKTDFLENSFDVIYSRDAILHIYDKLSLFKSFLKWLKPGGTLFISDYARCDPPYSDEFEAYLADRQYHLETPARYTQFIRDAGFTNVEGKDNTEMFKDVLNRELEYAQTIKPEYVAEFGQKDFDYIIKGWEQKLVRIADGEQKWGIYRAYKPKKANL